MRHHEPFAVKADGLGFQFDQKRTIFLNASFHMTHPSVTAILGPSGSGKTTFLKLLCGLLEGYTGHIEIFGHSPIQARSARLLGFIQQQPVLLRWRTVAHNIMLAADIARDAHRRSEVAAACEQVGLSDAMHLYPHQLSVGMAARVALARSILLSPKLILLDEPFAHVDESNRRHLELLVRTLHERLSVSFLLVTHNLDEAVFLADRVVILDMNDKHFSFELPITLGKPRSNASRYTAGFRELVRQLSERLNLP
jgi:NitT/TauT family transport system ATP-binding protein